MADDLDNVLLEGYGAAREGADLTSCPYTMGSAEAIEWMLGHWGWQLEQAGGITFVTGDELKLKE